MSQFQIDPKFTDWQLINTQDRLDDFLSAIASADYLSIDTEFRRESTYHAELALIQIATADQLACIDPLAKLDLSQLIAIFESDKPKYFHSIYQDAEVLMTALNARLQRAIDSQLYAAFGGHPDQISYRQAVEMATGVELDKSASRSDWMQRPLSAKQMHYAKLDVVYLFDVVEHFKDALQDSDKVTWTEQETERLVAEATSAPDFEAAAQRVKLREPLAELVADLLAKLHAWREQVAVQRDKPRQWIAADYSLLSIAEIASDYLSNGSVSELDQTKLLAEIQTILEADRRADKSRAAEILDCLISRKDVSFNALKNRPEHDPEQNKQLKLLGKLSRSMAEQQEIPVSLLASNKMINAHWQGLSSPTNDRDGWRWALIGKPIQSVIDVENEIILNDDGSVLLEPVSSSDS